jgi:energy-coupling factor transporter ATP-binding protein EcfA2
MNQKEKKPLVFVAYSHTDVEVDILNYIIDKIKENSNNRIDVVTDKQKLRIGDDFVQYMDLIDKADYVLILMTPNYKKKVVEKQDYVYYEYKKILNRYFSKEQSARNLRDDEFIGSDVANFGLLPILLSGNKEQSIPDELSTLIYEDFVGLHVSERDGKYLISRQIEDKYTPKFKNIISKIRTVSLSNEQSFRLSWTEYFKLLFQNSKSEWDKQQYHKYLEEIFVKTDVFNKVRQQEAWFIIGRKGSGKSTITDVLPNIDPHYYLFTVAIYANDISLHTCYNIFTANGKGFDSDSKNIWTLIKAFKACWEAFIYLCIIYKLVQQYEKGDFRDVEIHNIRKFKKVTYEILNQKRTGVEQSDMNTLFLHAFSSIAEYTDQVIKSARPNKFFGADIGRGIDARSYRYFVIPSKTLDALHDVIARFGKKILVTFDGIDTDFDLFRKESIRGKTDDIQDRAIFEVDWLNALMLLVLNQGVVKDESRKLYDQLHFCITIPKDRFLEVREIDRDTYRHNGKFAPLNWSGIELAILLRKRLEKLIFCKSDKVLKPEDRLAQVLSTCFPKLPREISFEFNSRKYSINLFFYVLRHTFWRPRDILFYYTSLLALVKECEFKKTAVTSEQVREVIRLTTKKVVKGEFINEFNVSFGNIEDVLEGFRGKKQTLSYDEIASILNGMDIRLASGSLNEISIADKIEFLYQIGVIGLEIGRDIVDKFYSINKHAFIFNEGSFVLEQIGKDNFLSQSFVIHPVFCEYLQINTTEQKDLISQYNWEYLHDKETFRNVLNDF